MGGGGSEPRAGHARAGARQEICDSSRGRSFDVGVKTRRPRRGTHAETLRAGQTAEGHSPARKSEGGQHKVSEEVWDASAWIEVLSVTLSRWSITSSQIDRD
ncbi:hypothetical protein D4764_04G0008430 [Takifugu flavidus]|uniref:Uncharacterized protein n=1 Tax=Takifugu flavidus TaxID=433684 RepID=A0A5C6N4H8_9TELE|nr:hypothetical protein D4764_04G0008430 [Takifugu flavidus]